MGITFTNNWKNISDKLRSTLRTEFKGALPVFINDEPISTGGQFLQLDLAGTELSQKLLGAEIREYSVTMNYIYQNPNIKKSSLDHVLRYVSRIEKLMQNNISLTLTDSTAAVNCRVESTTLEEGLDSYLVSFDWKCQHVSGLSESISTLPIITNTKSVDFDGTNDYLDAGTNINDITSQSCTVAGWYKITSGHDVATDGRLTFFSRGGGSATSGYNFRYEDNGGTKRIIIQQKKASGYDYIAYNVTLATNTWHHIAWVNGGTNSKSTIFVNGSAVASDTHTDNIVSASGVKFKIGIASQDDASFIEPFNGNIDEVAFWNTALDGDAVKAVYNNAKPTDLTMNNGAYDEYTDNLKGYWRMGDGTLDSFPLIADQVNPTLGSELNDNNWTLNDNVVGDNWSQSGTALINDGSAAARAYNSGTVTVGSIFKISYDITVYTSGNVRVDAGATVGTVRSGVGSYSEYLMATSNTNLYINQVSRAFVGTIDNISVKMVNGNPSNMTNMEAADIEEDTP